MGLKSERPLSTKWDNTLAQSSRESQAILAGGSTSTGITWEVEPHWIMTTRVPIPPLWRHRSSRRLISAMTRGSRMYVRGTTWVAATENLILVGLNEQIRFTINKRLTDGVIQHGGGNSTRWVERFAWRWRGHAWFEGLEIRPIRAKQCERKWISEVSLQDSRRHIREQRRWLMPALIVLRCAGRSVYGMASESFDNLVTKNKRSVKKLCWDHRLKNIHSTEWSSNHSEGVFVSSPYLKVEHSMNVHILHKV